jgi:hypothetical protein
MTLMTSGVIKQHLWRSFHKKTFKIISRGGLGTGMGSYVPKGEYFEGDHSDIEQWGA